MMQMTLNRHGSYADLKHLPASVPLVCLISTPLHKKYNNLNNQWGTLITHHTYYMYMVNSDNTKKRSQG